MGLLADVGISMSTIRTLRQQGHDIVHLRVLQLRCKIQAALTGIRYSRGLIEASCFNLELSVRSKVK